LGSRFLGWEQKKRAAFGQPLPCIGTKSAGCLWAAGFFWVAVFFGV